MVDSFIASDTQPTNLSRSSSISLDNPSIDGLSSNDENQISNFIPVKTDSPLLTTTTTSGLSSSLSELDPMFNNRPRTPSPLPSPIIDEQIITTNTDEQIMTNSTEDRSSLTDTFKNEPLIIEKSTSIAVENQPSIIEKQTSVSVEDSINTSEKNEPSLSISINSAVNDLSIERKNDDLFQIIEEDTVDLP